MMRMRQKSGLHTGFELANKPLRKSKGKQPITRHPLFPATVALWFGALFGLGSLAIRPGLLEAVVVTLQLDAVFSSMAPPLGATARLLVALAMALLGGAFGFALARKLATPDAAGLSFKRSKAVKPKEANTAEAGADDGAIFSAGQRRRALAIEEQPPEPDYGDRAPLPGSSPQIFDVAEFDLDGFEDPAPVETEDQPLSPDNEPSTEESAGESPLELDPELSMAEEPAQQPEPETQPASAGMDPSPTAQPGGGLDSDEDSAWPGVRKPVAFAPSEPAPPANASGAVAGSDRFDLARLASSKPGSVFDTKPSQPLFEKPDEPLPNGIQSQDAEPEQEEAAPTFAAPSAQTAVPAPSSKPSDPEPASNATPAVPAGSKPAEDVAAPVGEASLPKEARDARADGNDDRIASANPDELSNVELLERLALTMNRRRERPVATAPATTVAKADIPEELPAAPEEVAPVAAPEPVAQAVTEQVDAPPAAEIPAALRPVQFDDSAEEEPLPAFIPPRHIGATGEAERDEEVPPFAAPAKQDAPKGLSRLPSLPDGKVEEATEGQDAAEDEHVLEEGYSSLLNLSRQGSGPATGKGQFIRVEEPERDSNEIEPVVVFPGQASRNPAPFAKPENPEPEEAETQSAPEPEIPVHADGRPPFAPPPEENPAGKSAKRQDPEETERALRSALATLQRMSGAA